RDFAIIGFASNDMSTDSYRQYLTQEIKQFTSTPVEPEIWNWFLPRIYYHHGDFKDPGAFKALADMLKKVASEQKIKPNHFYYLATAPQFFAEVVQQLGTAGLAEESGGLWRRVIIEKPFGRDLDSAKALNVSIKQVLQEKQI